MSRVRAALNHKLTQFILLLLLAFLVFQFGIPWLSSVVTGTAAPVPAHLMWTIYMPLVVFVLLLFISADERWWSEFKRPLRTLIVEQEPSSLVRTRRILLVAIPLLAGLMVYLVIRPDVSAPPELRSIHPAPPGSVTVDGQQIDLRTAVNPFRGANGALDPSAVAEGGGIYGRNCVVCHGDSLEGNGLFAASFRPASGGLHRSGHHRAITRVVFVLAHRYRRTRLTYRGQRLEFRYAGLGGDAERR